MRNNTDREINDLYRNIQAAQARVNDIYAAIGRTYYSENREPQGAYVQMFADLKATEEQIEQMNTRVKFLNGIVVCTNCHSDNSVNSAFCSVCGSRLPHTFAADGANRCVHCGNIINPGQMFCGSCGAKVEVPQPQFSEPVQPVPQPQFSEPVQPSPQPQFSEPVQPVPQPQFSEPVQPEVQDAAAEEPAVQPEEPQPVVQEQGRFCPNCHAPIIADDAVFCAECGTRL